MKKPALINGVVSLTLTTIVCLLTAGILNPCYAQDQEKGAKPVPSPKTSTWVALGGKFQKGLSALNDGTYVWVFGVGTDNALWTVSSEDTGKTWGAFIGHGGDNVRTAPACETEGTGRFRCYWVYGGALYSRLVTASGNGDEPYIKIGEKNLTPNPPSVVGDRVFAHGFQDDGVWFLTTKEGKLADAWDSRGGKLKWGPSCVADGTYHDNRDKFNIDRQLFSCFAVGTDNAVWVEKHDPKYSLQSDEYHNVWSKVGGQAIDGVNAWRGDSSAGTLIAVRGTDSTLWVGRYDWQHPQNGWQWKNFPGEISSVPACTNVVGTRNYCFAILPDGQLGFLDLTGKL